MGFILGDGGGRHDYVRQTSLVADVRMFGTKAVGIGEAI
jgi:hypothetical protein